jgi:hypothetical protein
MHQATHQRCQVPPRSVAARKFQFFISSDVFVRQLYQTNDSLNRMQDLFIISYLNMHEYLLTFI